MIFKFPFSQIATALALALSVESLLAQENLFYQKQKDGSVFFQLQGLKKDASYSVQIIDAKSGKKLASIQDFEKDAVPRALKTTWKPEENLNALCYWNILRDGENVSPAMQPVKMPEKFHVGQAKIKRAQNAVTWSQSNPSISRIFVANRSGMLIAWVKPWGFSNAGSFISPWNFKDVGSVRSYRTDSDIHAFVQRVPLNQRWIVLGNVPFTAEYAEQELLANISLPKIPYDFNLSLPGASLESGEEGTAEAVYLAKGGMPVRVSLDAESKKKMGGRRFEILLFLNGEFIHEEAQGVDPYTFTLPEFEGVKGRHHFTVNIIDYHGNIASKTLAMEFKTTSSAAENPATTK